MSFVTPGFLWALPLAAMPILFHLFSRKRDTVPFSDLTLLRQIYARAQPRMRLRQWLLTLARCGILFFLVLAYSGPVPRAPSRGAGPGASASEGIDLVLLLDNSYSMGFRERGKTRFELVKADGVELLKGLQNFDRVAVAVFSDKVEGALQWHTPAGAIATLARARLGFGVTDYAPALAAAQEFLVKVSGRRSVVLVLSDGARHGLRSALPTLDPGLIWLGLRWPGAPGNEAILSAGPAAQSNARQPLLAVRIRGAGQGGLELRSEGRRLADVALKAGAAEQNVKLPLPAKAMQEESSWFGQASLRPDALAADDVYYYSFRHAARRKALFLYGNPAFFKAPNAGFFIKELFDSTRESLLEYDADFLELDQLGAAHLADYRLVILADFKAVAAPAAWQLERFVRGGGGLFILAGARVSATGFDAINPWLPGQYGALVNGEGPGIKPSAPQISKLWRGFDLDKIRVDRYYLLQARPGAAVDFKSATGYPLLVSGSHGQGRVALWASALDLSWSNLAVKPAFAAWVEAVMENLSAEAPQARSESLDVKVGAPLIHRWPLDKPAPASVALRGPEGRETTLWLKDRRIEYGRTLTPGLYMLTEHGSGRRSITAVNLDRGTGESDLTALENPPWRPIPSDALISGFALRVYGRNARGAALFLVALLLLLEMFLVLPKPAAALILLPLFLVSKPAAAQQADRFVWAQLKLGAQWDPYPAVAPQALEMLSTFTSVLVARDRRTLTLKDKALFSSPLVILAARQAPPPLDDVERASLRDYLLAGGMLWIDDSSGADMSTLDGWVRRTLLEVLPEGELSPLSNDHVLYKTFFLLRGPAGRVMVRDRLEGLSWSGRTAVIYSRNDIHGAWAKDALGRPLYPCSPGGEAQRQKAKRLTINIIMYALTGNYKEDAVHQPYLLQKMRSSSP